jgi:hypothetical protein
MSVHKHRLWRQTTTFFCLFTLFMEERFNVLQKYIHTHTHTLAQSQRGFILGDGNGNGSGEWLSTVKCRMSHEVSPYPFCHGALLLRKWNQVRFEFLRKLLGGKHALNSEGMVDARQGIQASVVQRGHF